MKLSASYPPRVGDLVIWEGVHAGIVEEARGIDVLVRWAAPIKDLPGCSLPCTSSWLPRASVNVLARAKEMYK